MTRDDVIGFKAEPDLLAAMDKAAAAASSLSRSAWLRSKVVEKLKIDGYLEADWQEPSTRTRSVQQSKAPARGKPAKSQPGKDTPGKDLVIAFRADGALRLAIRHAASQVERTMSWYIRSVAIADLKKRKLLPKSTLASHRGG